jgi:hypothetical protein
MSPEERTLLVIRHAIDFAKPIVVDFEGETERRDLFMCPHLFGLRKAAKTAKIKRPTMQLFGYRFDEETKEAIDWRWFSFAKIREASFHDDEEVRWHTRHDYELSAKIRNDFVRVYRAWKDPSMTQAQWEAVRSQFCEPTEGELSAERRPS